MSIINLFTILFGIIVSLLKSGKKHSNRLGIKFLLYKFSFVGEIFLRNSFNNASYTNKHVKNHKNIKLVKMQEKSNCLILVLSCVIMTWS